MHIVKLDHVHPALVKSMAELAADLVQPVNPFPADHEKHTEWQAAFDARAKVNAEECAS